MNTMNGKHDYDIIQAVLSGKTERFGTLVEYYMPAVRATAMARLRNEMDAEDVMQEAFIKAFQSLHQLKDGKKFGAWLLTITRNLCSRRYAHKSREVSFDAAHKELPIEKPDPAASELAEVLHKQILRLDEEKREMLLLYYFADKSLAEIAALLNISYAAAGKRLQRARDVLGEGMLKQVQGAVPYRASRDKVAKVMAAIATTTALWQPGAEAASITNAGAVSGGGFIGLKGVLMTAVAVAIVAGIFWSIPYSMEATILSTDVNTVDAGKAASPVPEMEAPAESNVAPKNVHAADTPLEVTVSGRVFEKETGEGLPGLRVHARAISNNRNNKSGHSNVTDKDGNYQIDGLAAGKYEFSLGEARPNKGSHFSNNWSHRQEAILAAGVANVVVDVPYSKGTYVSGIVVDEKGNPVFDADIHVATKERIGGPEQSWQDGRFEYHHLQTSDALYIQARSENKCSVIHGPFVLSNSGIHDLKLVLNTPKNGVIAGKVKKGSIFSSSTVKVFAVPTNNVFRNIFSETTSRNGSFTITNLCPEKYNIGITDKSNMMHTQISNIEVTPGETVSGIVLSDIKGLTISGCVTDQNNNPIQHVDVEAVGEGTFRRAKTDEQGNYTIELLPKGTYELRANHKKFSHVRRQNIRTGSKHANLVMPPCTILTGSVVESKNGNPVQLYSIEIDPEPYQHSNLEVLNYTKKEISNKMGRFRLESIRTGTLYLQVSAKGHTTQNTTIELKNAGEIVNDIEIELQPSNQIVGWVCDEKNKPVSGACIFVGSIPHPLSRDKAKAVSAKDGSFTLEGLGSDETALFIYHDDYMRTSINIPTRPAQPVKIIMEQGNVLEGFVTLDGFGLKDNPFAYVEGGTVIAYCVERPELGKWSATVSNEGNYRIVSLPKGEYVVTVSLIPSKDAVETTHTLSQMTYVDAEGVTTLHSNLIPGNATLTGVMTRDDREVRHGNLLITCRDNEAVLERFITKTDFQGHYRIDVLPGETTCQVVISSSRGPVSYSDGMDIMTESNGIVELDLPVETQQSNTCLVRLKTQ